MDPVTGFPPEGETQVFGKNHPAGVSTTLGLPKLDELAGLLGAIRRRFVVPAVWPCELAVTYPAKLEIAKEQLECLVMVAADAGAQGHVDRDDVAILQQRLLGRRKVEQTDEVHLR